MKIGKRHALLSECFQMRSLDPAAVKTGISITQIVGVDNHEVRRALCGALGLPPGHRAAD